MHTLSAGEAFGYAVGGGVALEALGFYKIRKSSFPEWTRTFRYWFWTIVMILIGGGLAVAYVKSEVALDPILAINIGAAAPVIIERLSAAAPSLSPGSVD